MTITRPRAAPGRLRKARMKMSQGFVCSNKPASGRRRRRWLAGDLKYSASRNRKWPLFETVMFVRFVCEDIGSTIRERL